MQKIIETKNAMTVDETQKIVNEFYGKHRSLFNNGHKIQVIDSMSQIGRTEEKVKGFHRASAKSNDTYIVASEHNSKEDILSTLKHEIYGHYGLNTLTREMKLDILLCVVHMQDEELKNEWQQVRYDYPEEREFRQAEEVFCMIAAQVSEKLEFQHGFVLKYI